MNVDSTRAPGGATTLTTKNDFASALRSLRSIKIAFDEWSKSEETAADMEVWQAGYDAMGDAHTVAINSVSATLATTLPDIAAKAEFIATLPDFADVIDPWAMKAIRALADDLSRLIDRPTQDAFAVKLARYSQAVRSRDDYTRAHAPEDNSSPEQVQFEAAMDPMHSEVFDAAVAALLEPAPDVAAMVAKREMFEEMEMWGADEPNIMKCIFADAIALAGGAA